MKAYLILENGSVYDGIACGADKQAVFDLVLNTSMVGYMEALTNPSYAGKGVLMTYPIIGNYGVCEADAEAEKPWAEAFILREMAQCPSNFRSEGTLEDYLVSHGIPAIQGIDTRALAKQLSLLGPTRAMLTTKEPLDLESVLNEIRGFKYGETDYVSAVTCADLEEYDGMGAHIVILDLGTPRSLVKAFHDRGCFVTVVPATMSIIDLFVLRPNGVVLSPGPGNPAVYENLLGDLKVLYSSKLPVLGIGLGHQLLAMATGAASVRQHKGHHGANIPVRDLSSGKTYITSQNHDYTIDRSSIDPEIATVLFENVNDATVEGLSYIDKRIKSVQFNPDTTINSKETGYLLDSFIAESMRR